MAATVASMTGACSSLRDADDDANGVGTSVVMVGDSITFMSLEPLHSVLAAEGFTDVTIDAVPGRPIADGGAVVDLAVSSGASPDVWVIALGTNDLYRSTDVDAYRNLVDGLLEHVPDGDPVVWVDTYVRDRVPEAEAFNTALAAALDDRGGGTIAAWFDLCSQQGDVLLVADGVHPSEQGTLAFADTVRRALTA